MAIAESSNLLPRIATGDESAVSDFINRYGGFLWTLVQRFTASTAQAEATAEELFGHFWETAGDFPPAAVSEMTHVGMVARRFLLERFRELHVKSEPPIPVSPVGLDRAGPDDDPESVVTRDLLRKLPGEQLLAVRLAIVDGLSPDRISSATGLSVKSVSSLLREALVTMRQHMGMPSAGGPNRGAR